MKRYWRGLPLKMLSTLESSGLQNCKRYPVVAGRAAGHVTKHVSCYLNQRFTITTWRHWSQICLLWILWTMETQFYIRRPAFGSPSCPQDFSSALTKKDSSWKWRLLPCTQSLCLRTLESQVSCFINVFIYIWVACFVDDFPFFLRLIIFFVIQ